MESRQVNPGAWGRGMRVALLGIAVLASALWIWQASMDPSIAATGLTPAEERAAADRALIDVRAGERSLLTPAEERAAADRALIDVRRAEREEDRP